MPKKVSPIHFLLFLCPLLFCTVFLYLLIAWSVYISLVDWRGITPSWNFVGLQNYAQLFRLERFYIDLKNNALWLILFMAPTSALGLILAYIVEVTGRGETFFRTVFLYPAALSFVVSGTLWTWMYAEEGVINTILKALGLSFLAGKWIADPDRALYCLIFAAIWQYLGFAMVIYLAAIKGIQRSTIEAAILDGATGWKLFWYVVLPQIKHANLVVIPLLALSALKIFDLVWVMTMGGPGYATDVLAVFMWQAAFAQHFVSLGAAIAVILFLLSLVVVIPYAKMALERWFK